MRLFREMSVKKIERVPELCINESLLDVDVIGCLTGLRIRKGR